MRRRHAFLGTLLLLVPLGVVVQAPAAGAGVADPQVCGGTVATPQVLAGGTYASLHVNGVCDISGGSVVVTGSVVVDAGGALVSAYGLRNNIQGTTSDLNIYGDLTTTAGASIILGCESSHFACLDDPNPGSPTLTSTTVVHGNLTADSPLGFILHRVTVGGDLRSTGGGGGKTCANSPGANVFYAIPGNGHSVYSDLEDSTVGGNLWSV